MLRAFFCVTGELPAVSTTTEVSAWRSLLERASFVDSKSSSFEFLSVGASNSCLCFFFRRHFHETETLGSAAHTINNDLSGLNCTELREVSLEGFICGSVREATNI